MQLSLHISCIMLQTYSLQSMGMQWLRRRIPKVNGLKGGTLTLSAFARILPQLMASSGLAPASLPSNSPLVLMYTAKSAPLRMRFALQM
jgi:hypothetical protein